MSQDIDIREFYYRLNIMCLCFVVHAYMGLCIMGHSCCNFAQKSICIAGIQTFFYPGNVHMLLENQFASCVLGVQVQSSSLVVLLMCAN